MSLYEICQAIQDSHIGTAIRESEIVFPAIESVHVPGLAVSAVAIASLDLRLTGLGVVHLFGLTLLLGTLVVVDLRLFDGGRVGRCARDFRGEAPVR